jgi:hypothetical protein
MAAIFSVFLSKTPFLLWTAVACMVLVLLITFIRTSIYLCKPTAITGVYVKLFSTLTRFVEKYANNNFKHTPVEDLSDDQAKKRKQALQYAVYYNFVCRFTGQKLRAYQQSGLNYASYAMNLFMLAVLTVFSFACINLGLYKIDPHYFHLANVPGFFDFFYYSFSAFLSNTIPEIYPDDPVSKIVLMGEYCFAIFALIIVVSIFLPVRSRKQADELDNAIVHIEQEGVAMEMLLQREYSLSLVDAEAHLTSIDPDSMEIVRKAFK